ncbi:MAG TPA: hypothetical protein DCM26_00330 [Desulfotomaculum sp.]|jgi:non-ribosomal peptide synthetase component F|nr:hypothetical protein [Desulfotomaculum sp.]
MFRAALLEERAAQIPDKTFLLYENKRFTYSQMDQNANKVANLIKLFGTGWRRTLTEESFIIRDYPERRAKYANDETSDPGTLFQNILPSV